jgi:hypothetical protein
MGREFVGKGVNIALSPMMNMVRLPQAGRNWEGFGGDPFLTGEAAYETILGLQASCIFVYTCISKLISDFLCRALEYKLVRSISLISCGLSRNWG